MELPADADIHTVARWVLDSAVRSKETLVSAEGIGADLNPSIIAWHDGHVMAGARMLSADGDYLRRLASCCAAMVTCLGADGLTIVCDSFVSLGGERGGDLRARFASGDQDVQECLSLAHVEGTQSVLLVRPYRYEVGRKLAWEDTKVLATNDQNASRHTYVAHEALLLPRVVLRDGDTQELGAKMIQGYGFSLEVDSSSLPT